MTIESNEHTGNDPLADALIGPNPTAAQLDAYARAKEAQAAYRADVEARAARGEVIGSVEQVRCEPLALSSWYFDALSAQVPLAERLTPPASPVSPDEPRVLDALKAKPKIVLVGQNRKPGREGNGIG